MDEINILLAEHNEDLRRALAAYLNQRAEFSVVGEASNGADALHLLEKKTVHVVITCIVMPVMNGYLMLEKMQQMNLSPKPKAIVLSAFPEEALSRRVCELGVSCCLVKPVQPERLCACIRRSLCKACLCEELAERR